MFSAFALPLHPSYVYIEAPSFIEALDCLYCLPNYRIPLFPSVFQNDIPWIMPLKEHLLLLMSFPLYAAISPLSFVWVIDQDHLYDGDIGFVLSKGVNGLIKLALLPHITNLQTHSYPVAIYFDIAHFPNQQFKLQDNETVVYWPSSYLIMVISFMIIIQDT